MHPSLLFFYHLLWQKLSIPKNVDNTIILPFLLAKEGITPLWQRGATCLREAASAKAGGRFSK